MSTDGNPPHPLPPTTTTASNTRYTHIRFLGYALPTTAANLVAIGDPNGQGMVGGSYLGHEDFTTDFKARLNILKNAVDTAKAALPCSAAAEGGAEREREVGVMNVFMAPEFYWHGDEGPYLHASDAKDPVDDIMEALAETFPEKEYPHWLIVAGTAITAKVDNKEKLYNLNSTHVRNNIVENLCKQWRNSYGPLSEVVLDMIVNFVKNAHAYPLLEVRNRALIVSNILLDVPDKTYNTRLITTEKYFFSNEDLLLYEVNGKKVVTEQMTTYPAIDLTAGDIKKTPTDKKAIFRINHGDTTPLDVAVECCLDHRDVRLRRNVGSHPESLHLQLIPSCGMQIKANGVAIDENGLVFNVDGQYPLDTLSEGVGAKGVVNDVPCVYVNHVYAENSKYGAHTQLTRVKEAAIGAHVQQKGSVNAKFHDENSILDINDVKVLPVKAMKSHGNYFAGGPGHIHIYGYETPLRIHLDS